MKRKKKFICDKCSKLFDKSRKKQKKVKIKASWLIWMNT